MWRFWKRIWRKELELTSFSYDAESGVLTVSFSDKTSATHTAVKLGYVIGLQMAADKLDFYDTCIRNSFPLAADKPCPKESGEDAA